MNIKICSIALILLELCFPNDAAYIFVQDATKVTFADREADCVARFSGHLASIHSLADNTAVSAACLDVGQFQLACAIGINNAASSSQWADGTTATYTNWAGNEPDGGAAQPMVSMRQDGFWYTGGDANVPYICEGTSMNPTVTPTATPTSMTINPSSTPTVTPSASPTVMPSRSPSMGPSMMPSVMPTVSPSAMPSKMPTVSPTITPSMDPSASPSMSPSTMPSSSPIVPPSLIFVTDPTKTTFADREADCAAQFGGHLVSIHSAAENAAVVTACSNVNQNQGACAIGLNNAVSTSVWSDGTAVTYTNWFTGEPDGGAAQPMVTIRQDGLWHTGGEADVPYICEGYTMNPTKSPTVNPSASPTMSPSMDPSASPTMSPSKNPTMSPVPTTPPTASPIDKTCTKDVNYVIDGSTCKVWGDPHTDTFNGFRHDYMGQPNTGKDTYYYVTRCNGESVRDMPFSITGTHNPAAGSTVTYLKHVNLELEDDDGKKYSVMLSPYVRTYEEVGGTSMDITAGVDTAIGNRFKVEYTQNSASKITVVLTIDDTCSVNFYMEGNDGTQNLYITPPECYRCFICGLCGDFKRQRAGGVQRLETCDGGFVDVSGNFNYDIDGNSWEVSSCQRRRRRRLLAMQYTPDVGDTFVAMDTCDTSIEAQVITACQTARDANTACCDSVGGGLCDKLQETCEYDACVVSGTDATAIDANVETFFTEPLNLGCTIPNIAELEDEARIIADVVLDEYEFPTPEPTNNPTTPEPSDNPTMSDTSTTQIMGESDTSTTQEEGPGDNGTTKPSVLFAVIIGVMMLYLKV